MGAEAHDGTRTRDLFLTKEVLYHLSYVSPRRRVPLSGFEPGFPPRRRGVLDPWPIADRDSLVTGQEGLEPPTPGFGDRCSTD